MIVDISFTYQLMCTDHVFKRLWNLCQKSNTNIMNKNCQQFPLTGEYVLSQLIVVKQKNKLIFIDYHLRFGHTFSCCYRGRVAL